MIAKIAAKASCVLLVTIFSFTATAQLSANFTATPLSGCSPLVVQFTDQSTGNPILWQWDLGNGTISFLQNPSVTYFNPGQYTVKLTIHSLTGVDSIVKTQYITVFAGPTPAFIGSPTSGCAPLPVTFTDQSIAGSGTVSNWQWDFGDGAVSTFQNPSHTYASVGNFNVTLMVVNSNGCTKTITKTSYITITAAVHAAFSNNSPATCNPPVTINFQDSSTGTGTLSYLWSFGDGSTSTSINPSHTYTASGNYTVQLIVTNNSACRDTITKPDLIAIGSVHASFIAPANVCVSTPFTINNTSSPSSINFLWDFGDGTSSTSDNPVKAYSLPGSYQIHLKATLGVCADSTVQTINVSAQPTAAFTGNILSSCKAPLAVTFTDQSLNAVSYHWDFGDGNTSTLQNPSHTYTSEGSYNVTLVASNVLGCMDTLEKVNYINIQPPLAVINGVPDSSCAPFTKLFTTTVTSGNPVTGYQWDFGDGGTSNAASPTHTFLNPGSYTISLIITTTGGCSDTVIIPHGIIVSPKPVANFTATPTNTCAKTPVNFTDLTTGGASRWFWTFGDGGTSSVQNPSHKYSDTGYFDVQLIVWNGGCPDTIKFKNYIHINPPIAMFAISFDCDSPRTRVFTDHSIGADKWNWDFGDGDTSTIPSPEHTYTSNGSYVVSLTVINIASGCDYTASQTVQIAIVHANFFASDTIICKNNPITFTVAVSNPGDVGSYRWDFGDGFGASGTANNITHVYQQSGTYTVSLITTNILGCEDTLTKTLYIRVNGPTAKFGLTVQGSCLNNAVTFIDSSTTDGIHPIKTWIWNYGDGTKDTLTAGPFQHTYSSPGIYPISLTVTDTTGCSDTYTIAQPLIISRPTAAFISNDTLTCPAQPVAFINQSLGITLTYLWNFGDGATSSAQNPTHPFASDGIYNIKLIVTDKYGCMDSIYKPAYIDVVSPVANFSMSDSVSTCPPLLVNFTNTSQNGVSYQWDFGDGASSAITSPSHFYTYPGIYTAQLTVTGPGGCQDIMKRTINIKGPTGTFTYSPLAGCKPLTVNFSATAQNTTMYVWDFSDGTTIDTTADSISHTYTYPGYYIPKMILVDAGGCHVPIVGLNTISVNGVIANFGLSQHLLCDSGLVFFYDSSISNEPITNYNWSFGDGNTGSVQNPTHEYTDTGLYYPRLITTSQSGCLDTSISAVPVKVVASPKISISSTPDSCVPLHETFNGNILVADTSALTWSWKFGNGDTSTLQDPPQETYPIAGIYHIDLVATNSSGCSTDTTATVQAFPLPIVDGGGDAIVCIGNGVTLNATGANSYVWSPGATLSCTNCANPVATPVVATTYTVIGTTLHGCSDSDSLIVTVDYPFPMTYGTPANLCIGSSTSLFASGAFSYVWTPPAGLNNATSASPSASPDTTTTYRVIGTDDAGCFSDTGFVTITVYPIPTVNAGQDTTINVSRTATLTAVVSNDVTQVAWTSDSVTSTGLSITVQPDHTTDYTVQVTNAGGCKASDDVTVYVICNGANVFIPNTFSPNGDGNNDVFYPRGTGLFRIQTFRIFNRWGQVLFERENFMANDATFGWDGTFKGVKLDPDVFVYMIDILCDNNSVLKYKGNIALIR